MLFCKFCLRTCKNEGALKAHELCCAVNPSRLSRKRSPLAGAKKGFPSKLKGQQFKDRSLSRILSLVNTSAYLKFKETHIRRVIKTYLLHTTGVKCSICHITTWQGRDVPLVCDHIDGNSENNDLNNFRLVCCNCDAQLPTFKSKNKGRGRIYDLKYRKARAEVGSSNALEKRGN